MFRVTLVKFCIEDPQILGAAVWNLVTTAIRSSGFVHHKFNIRVGIYVSNLHRLWFWAVCTFRQCEGNL